MPDIQQTGNLIQRNCHGKSHLYSKCFQQRSLGRLYVMLRPFRFQREFESYDLSPNGCRHLCDQFWLVIALNSIAVSRVVIVYVVSSWRIIMIAAGPTRTTKIPGKMKSTSGKIILTAVAAAFSSAI